jgi:Lipase.
MSLKKLPILPTTSLPTTGLDPTIIFYQTNNKTKDLDSTDALFVDVIHTAAGVLGQWGPSGHADYYVNGGTSQPGCGSFSIIEQLSCDHTKVSCGPLLYRSNHG